METIERIIANGMDASVFNSFPIINVTEASETLSKIISGNKFDSRPPFKIFSIVYLNMVINVGCFEKEYGWEQVCMFFSTRLSYKNGSLIPTVVMRADKTGSIDNDKFEVLHFEYFPGELRKFIQYEFVKYSSDQEIHLLDTSFLVAATMTFLNCRNIVLVDKPQLPSIARHYEKRYKIPQITYQELAVTPVSYRHKYNATNIHAGSIPLHLCRGHIKTYTAEKPLFGKLIGQYYWNSQMRGNKKNGEIKKDYRLKNN